VLRNASRVVAVKPGWNHLPYSPHMATLDWASKATFLWKALGRNGGRSPSNGSLGFGLQRRLLL
jgi:hypothetical protein